jgi:hypothetical protein
MSLLLVKEFFFWKHHKIVVLSFGLTLFRTFYHQHLRCCKTRLRGISDFDYSDTVTTFIKSITTCPDPAGFTTLTPETASNRDGLLLVYLLHCPASILTG